MFHSAKSEIPDTRVQFSFHELSVITSDQVVSVYEGVKLFVAHPTVKNSFISLVTVSFSGNGYCDYTNPRIEYTLNLCGFEQKKSVSFSKGNENPQQIADKLIESFDGEKFLADFRRESEQAIAWRIE